MTTHYPNFPDEEMEAQRSQVSSQSTDSVCTPNHHFNCLENTGMGKLFALKSRKELEVESGFTWCREVSLNTKLTLSISRYSEVWRRELDCPESGISSQADLIWIGGFRRPSSHLGYVSEGCCYFLSPRSLSGVKKS